MELRDIEYIINSHTNLNKLGVAQVRKWDNKTPYYVHPIWCATMILQETLLPEKIRKSGGQALLYHDVLEDTNKELPNWLSERVRSLVSDMTFDSSEQEWSNLWSKDKEVRLLKLYDKTSNLLDGTWMELERMKEHQSHLKRLCEDVEKNYGQLKIIKLARNLF